MRFAFPVPPPLVTLLRSVQGIARTSIAEESLAPRAVWMIHVWGCAPAPISKPATKGQTIQQIPDDAINHFRTIVDAETGEYYRSDSIPQPE